MRAYTGTEDKREEMGVGAHSSPPPRRAVKEWREKSSWEQNHSKSTYKALWITEMEMLSHGRALWI
jgi:hypothetical protein